MKKILQMSFLALLFVIVLSACNSAPEESTNSSNTSGNTNESANSKSAEESAEDAVVRIAMSSELDSLDPHQSSGTDTGSMMNNVFDGLLDTNEAGELVPNIAKEYEVSEDNLTYTFKLVENAIFHNGEPVTAKDVVYSYSKLAGLDTGEPLSDKWAMVEKVEALGDYEVAITLDKIDSGFLARTISPIIPEGYTDQATHPIGAGPFKFVEYKIGQELVLERFDEYYMEDKVPEVKEARFVILPDEETAILAMQSGEIDIIPAISEQGVMQLGDKITTISGPQNMSVILGLNHQVEPLNDVKVRQAINMAIDKQQIIDTVFQGNATRIDSNFSPAMPVYYEDSVEGYYDLDIAGAKELLAEAGYPEGFDLTLTAPSHRAMYTDTAQMIAEQLKQINVNVIIEPIEWSTWLDRVYTQFDHESTLIGFTGKIDPYDILIRFVDGYSRNFIHYNNPAYNQAIENATLEVDETKRADYYKEAQRILTEDAASVFLLDPDRVTAMRKGLSGLKLYPMQKFNLEDLTIDE
ncbi:ABC transporter substrate-binding protein [Bacillaceae bacterium SIJ1]|uniref:ABC transporter substrate-binding protein n=1 Tax=Litoribacterium kuwaitense TaxID=1398745 RepID=UPI0013EADA5E|nr:ABC transporter substrate-binding protein [Litoribacterium kuwaitense]NGP46667.1 ABC transporter substrate-binding protein [Litoribacterium kuwaitense]